MIKLIPRTSRELMWIRELSPDPGMGVVSPLLVVNDVRPGWHVLVMREMATLSCEIANTSSVNDVLDVFYELIWVCCLC